MSMVRREVPVFTGLNADLELDSDHRLAHRHHCPVQVEVGPAEAEYLAMAHAGRGGEVDRRVESLVDMWLGSVIVRVVFDRHVHVADESGEDGDFARGDSALSPPPACFDDEGHAVQGIPTNISRMVRSFSGPVDARQERVRHVDRSVD